MLFECTMSFLSFLFLKKKEKESRNGGKEREKKNTLSIYKYCTLCFDPLFFIVSFSFLARRELLFAKVEKHKRIIQEEYVKQAEQQQKKEYVKEKRSHLLQWYKSSLTQQEAARWSGWIDYAGEDFFGRSKVRSRAREPGLLRESHHRMIEQRIPSAESEHKQERFEFELPKTLPISQHEMSNLRTVWGEIRQEKAKEQEHTALSARRLELLNARIRRHPLWVLYFGNISTKRSSSDTRLKCESTSAT